MNWSFLIHGFLGEVKPCNVMLSMEKILGRNDFTWKELKQNDESVGIAFKGIGNDMYILFLLQRIM